MYTSWKPDCGPFFPKLNPLINLAIDYLSRGSKKSAFELIFHSLHINFICGRRLENKPVIVFNIFQIESGLWPLCL